MKKINKEQIKKAFFTVKDAWNDKQKHAIIMLAIMLIFFFLLTINIRNNNKSTPISSSTTTNNFSFSLEKIKNSNYHFKYITNIDNNITIYEGDTYKDKELFTMNSIDKFYKYNKIYLKDINDVWSKTVNPYILSDFKDIDNLEKILENSTYEEKTENKDKISIYTYKVSTTTLIKILETKDIDLDDMPNTIILTTDSDNEVVKIEYDLTPYSKYKNTININANTSIEYSNFDKIEEMEDPT